MYIPIEDYGLIGNMRTAALVGANGSIDWFCPRRFDTPSVFAAILDDDTGGRFQITPVDRSPTQRQMYWPETNILITRFLCEEGVAEIIDYMPVPAHESRWLVRHVKMVRGSLPLRVVCQPRFNYARDDHKLTITENGALFRSAADTLALSSPVALSVEDGAAIAHLTLMEGESAAFSLQIDGEPPLPALSESEEAAIFQQTSDYWCRWIEHCTYTGRWREMVHRSALALKLMTYEPTGAIVAAPTTSLPENMGGIRNWDYRYTWLRDAAFTVYGLMRIGFTGEAEAFVEWIHARMHELTPEGELQIMYTVDGGHEIDEITLDHLEGYRASAPVRVGNAAHSQLQLDIYGELMDSIYLANKYSQPISYDVWREVRRMLDWVCDNWQRTDKGIWEIRGPDQPFVYSKMMLWVALDRGVRLADKRSLPGPRDRWLVVRDRIYEEIIDRGYNDDIGAFTQYYDGETLDASNLLMPLVFFMSPRDPRMLSTLDAINRPPDKGGLVSDGLVYRYNVESGVDGLDGDEGSFNMCTFWLVEALTRAGRVEEARLMFEHMLGYANHLGLYAEETGPRGEALGNFPQAFTHLSLISAAYNLDRVLG
jgi:GH15 family glucan-1,4-alpha-glucosidase